MRNLYAWYSLRVTPFLWDLQAVVPLWVTTFTLVTIDYGFAFVLNYSVSCLYSNIYFHNVRSLCLVRFASDSFFVSSSSCCTSASDHVHTDWIWVKALFLIIMFTHLISQYEISSNDSCCCMLLMPYFSFELPSGCKLNCKCVLIPVVLYGNFIINDQLRQKNKKIGKKDKTNLRDT